jgi:hypothetical protein
MLDDQLCRWVDGRSGPEDVFGSPGHAAEVAIGRIRDELEELRRRCRDEGTTFSWLAARRVYADSLGAFVAVGMGPRPAGTRHVERRRKGMWVDIRSLDWVENTAAKHQFFHADESVPHAIETGWRILRAAEPKSGVRSEGFPLDREALWKSYKAAADVLKR